VRTWTSYSMNFLRQGLRKLSFDRHIPTDRTAGGQISRKFSCVKLLQWSLAFMSKLDMGSADVRPCLVHTNCSQQTDFFAYFPGVSLHCCWPFLIRQSFWKCVIRSRQRKPYISLLNFFSFSLFLLLRDLEPTCSWSWNIRSNIWLNCPVNFSAVRVKRSES